MELYLLQADIVFSRVDTTYAEAGETEETNAHSDMVEIHRKDNLLKICHLQIILQTQTTNTMHIQILQIILQEITRTTMYLPDGLDYQESVIMMENGDTREKIVSFLKINSETLKEPTYVSQYQKTYQQIKLKKK